MSDVGEYSPMPVDSVVNVLTDQNPGGIETILNLCQADEAVTNELKDTEKEILEIVMHLGGHVKSYNKERRAQLKKLVWEVYSAPRVTKAMKLIPSLDLLPGYALDLTGCDSEGNPWDFTCPKMRQKARDLVAEHEPYMIIGSPPCT